MSSIEQAYDPAMYEVQYILDGLRVASLLHAGELKDAREIAEDGVRRHYAQYAHIVHNETKHAEIWPPQQNGGQV